MIKIKKGLDLPIAGDPDQKMHDGPAARSVAIVGTDYVGMKPTMAIKEGDKVSKGQLLFTDKKTEGVKYTAPAAGTIASINRGDKRVLLSVVIDVEGDEQERFDKFDAGQLKNLSADQIEKNLVDSGLWTALRTRPFSKVPRPGTEPNSIFVTAIDTNALSPDPAIVIAEHAQDFANGLDLLTKLTSGPLYLCKAPGTEIPTGSSEAIQVREFDGPHPAGLPGTHIHYLDSVSETKTVWHIGYQDVIAVGKLFATGEIYTDRVVALAGPRVEQPRLVRTRMGASLDELTAGQLEQSGQENRVITGSVCSGRTARGTEAFLGRYHNQISVIQENITRDLLGYLSPGVNKHSVLNIFLSKFMKGKKFVMTTTTNGSPRAIVPIGAYETVMPLDILPTQLIKALVVGDLEVAQALGCLELDEEDLSLCTYVCPGKYEYGPILRDNLTKIEKEG